MSNGRNYGQCNEITVYGEQYIYELQLTYAGDPIWIKGKEERNEDGARGQCHLKSYQGQGHYKKRNGRNHTFKVAYLYEYKIHLK